MTTLYLLCGKIAAGKSTLARRLAERPATLLITMDHWMSLLFPTENRTIEDFARLSARLRAAMGDEAIAMRRRERAAEPGLRNIQADLCSGSGFDRLPKRPDAVVFCAAPDQRDEATYRGLYLDGLRRLLDIPHLFE